MNEFPDGVPARLPQEPVCKGIPGLKPHDSIHRRCPIASGSNDLSRYYEFWHFSISNPARYALTKDVRTDPDEERHDWRGRRQKWEERGGGCAAQPPFRPLPGLPQIPRNGTKIKLAFSFSAPLAAGSGRPGTSR